MINAEIYREYDIRGVYDQDFSQADAERIGQAFAALLLEKGGRRAAIGRDCRLSSDPIHEALVKGITGAGVGVVDFGVVPTPVYYYGVRTLEVDGGMMITASHNPPRYNGFKVSVGKDTIFGQEIQKFGQRVAAGGFPTGRAETTRHDITSEYIGFLAQNLDLKRRVSFAMDSANGTAGPVALPVFERLGSPAVPLFAEMDGNFPNHEPDPTKAENMKALAGVVVGQGLELGVGFDGDSDRLGVVDEKGHIIYGDMLMAIFARDILRTEKSGTFVAEVKCSKNLFDDIASHGGTPIMWRTGHSLIKQKLKETGGLLGGEMSGHMFFSHRYLGYDDGIYAACRLLEIVSRANRPVSQFLADLPRMHNTPEIRVDCPDDIKFKVVEQVKKELAKDHEIIDVDGVRVLFPDGWGLLRASNTGPLLVLRFEATSPGRLAEIRALVEDTLAKVKKSL